MNTFFLKGMVGTMRRKSALSIALTAVIISVVLLSGSLSVRAGPPVEYSCPAVSCVRNICTQELHEPQRNTAVWDISDDAISDMAALTAENGKSSENSQQISRFEMKSAAAAGTGSFELFRQKGRSGNDDWVFLVCGIGLIAAAIVIFAVTICTGRRTKKKRSKGK